MPKKMIQQYMYKAMQSNLSFFPKYDIMSDPCVNILLSMDLSPH